MDVKLELEIWKSFDQFNNFTTIYHSHALNEYRYEILKVISDVHVVLVPELAGNFGASAASVLVWMELYIKVPKIILPSGYFIKVFNYKLWLAIILCLIFIVSFLFVLKQKLKLSFQKYHEIIYSTFGISNLSFRMTLISYSFCQTIVALLKFIISASFSALLIVELLHMSYHLPFDDLNGIFRQNRYSLCVNDYSHAFEVILQNYGNSTGILNSGQCPPAIEFQQNPEYAKAICENPYCVFGFFDYLIAEDFRENIGLVNMNYFISILHNLYL